MIAQLTKDFQVTPKLWLLTGEEVFIRSLSAGYAYILAYPEEGTKAFVECIMADGKAVYLPSTHLQITDWRIVENEAKRLISKDEDDVYTTGFIHVINEFGFIEKQTIHGEGLQEKPSDPPAPTYNPLDVEWHNPHIEIANDILRHVTEQRQRGGADGITETLNLIEEQANKLLNL